MLKIGLTGGIGSGKSTLARHFKEGGIPHYDSDQRAKELMNLDPRLKSDIIALFGAQAYHDSVLNREYIAKHIFGDEKKREALNAIVHPAVVHDFEEWAKNQPDDTPYVIFESAILFDAGLESHFDMTLAVLAPEELRIMRVVNRDGVTLEQAKSRITAQLSEDELHRRADYSVVNIFEEDLEGSAKRLDQVFKYESTKKEDKSE